MKLLKNLLSLIGKLIRVVFIFFVISFLVMGVLSFFLNSWLEGNKYEDLPRVEEEHQYSEDLYLADSQDPEDSARYHYVKHHRVWYNYDHSRYAGDILVGETAYKEAKKRREDISTESYLGSPYYQYYLDHKDMYRSNKDRFYWTYVYDAVLENEKGRVVDLYPVFDSILTQNQLDRLGFANIIVSCIQNIPYRLIHPYTCTKLLSNLEDGDCSSFSCQYHADGRICMPEVRFGLQSPVEFSYNLLGDCDTRSLLLMNILGHYGYDVKLLFSREYSHAILGIHLPATGKYVLSQGKKYYVWETTAPHWQVGQIGAEYSNMNYWFAMQTSI